MYRYTLNDHLSHIIVLESKKLIEINKFYLILDVLFN